MVWWITPSFTRRLKASPGLLSHQLHGPLIILPLSFKTIHTDWLLPSLAAAVPFRPISHLPHLFPFCSLLTICLIWGWWRIPQALVVFYRRSCCRHGLWCQPTAQKFSVVSVEWISTTLTNWTVDPKLLLQLNFLSYKNLPLSLSKVRVTVSVCDLRQKLRKCLLKWSGWAKICQLAVNVNVHITHRVLTPRKCRSRHCFSFYLNYIFMYTRPCILGFLLLL